MHNCEDIAKLISESMDHSLSRRKRLAIRMHMLWCRCPVCRSYSRQMHAFREALKSYKEALVEGAWEGPEALSDEDRQAIKTALRQDG